jgi:tetratricopeptide (TPR) repeat protein
MGQRTWVFPLASLACTMLAIEAKADDWGACRSGNPDVSIFDCTAFIDAETDSTKNLAIAHYNRGRAYRDKGEFDRAISDLGKAIELDPEFLSAYRMRGLIRGLTGDYARAMADFGKALELSPDDEGIYLSRGLVYEAQGEKRKAAQDDRKILALSPGHKLATEALQGLGE